MLLATKNFGEIEVDKEEIISFEEGLPGFPNEKEFVLLRGDRFEDSQEQPEDSNNLFCWLQSVQNGDLAFVLLNVFMLMEYDPQVDEQELKALGEAGAEDYLIYNIAVVPDDIQKMRVNLRAPVVINSCTRQGKQFVCSNEEYSVRHYLVAQSEK